MAGVLGHNDRVDAGVEQPLNGHLLDSVVSQAWPVDTHMVGSPLQDAPKKVFTLWGCRPSFGGGHLGRMGSWDRTSCRAYATCTHCSSTRGTWMCLLTRPWV